MTATPWHEKFPPRLFTATVDNTGGACGLAVGQTIWVARYHSFFVIAPSPFQAITQFDAYFEKPREVWLKTYGSMAFTACPDTMPSTAPTQKAHPDIEIHMGPLQPYVIAPIDDPAAIEAALPEGWTIGDGWCSSQPSQRLNDGRWLLYMRPINEQEAAALCGAGVYHINTDAMRAHALPVLATKYLVDVTPPPALTKTVRGLANDVMALCEALDATRTQLRVARKLHGDEATRGDQ